MISCWGIHHLDIAQWGNGCDDTGPSQVEGTGEFPKEGGFDAIWRWKVRFEYARAAPVIFVSDGTPGYSHGVRFVGDSAWVHVARGSIGAHDDKFLRDPQNKYDTMPIKLPVSNRHTYNFVEAVKQGERAICDIETAVRSDTLCQIAHDCREVGPQAAVGPQARAVRRRRRGQPHVAGPAHTRPLEAAGGRVIYKTPSRVKKNRKVSDFWTPAIPFRRGG